MPVRISKNRVALENIPLNEAATVIVASATSTPIGAAASNNVDISGTTTITSFDTVAEGINRKGRFLGALTLTHNATSLILPGAANITTTANDRYEARSLGSGNWIVTKYEKADGTAVVQTAPTIQVFTGSGTWTKPAGCKKVKVTTVGGGGGGGASTANAGADGGTSSFGTHASATGGGGGAVSGGLGGLGGVGVDGTLNGEGADGGSAGGANGDGGAGHGGSSLYGGGGSGATTNSATARPGNSYGGGGGASVAASTNGGGGGGGGGYSLKLVDVTTISSVTVTVGAGGAGGAAGTYAGGNGGSGLIIVEEYY